MFIYSSEILAFVDEIMNNPVAVIILSVIFGGLYFLLDFFARKKFKEDNLYSSDDMAGIELLYKRDIKYLILNTALLGLPYLIFFILGFSHTLDQTAVYIFVGYFVVAGIVLNIVRKDPVLKILWKIKTFSLLYNYQENTDDYEVYVSETNVSVSRGNSFTVIFLFLLGCFLFVIKLMLFIIYAMLMFFANMALSVFVYPIMYTILLIRNHNMLKYGSYKKPHAERVKKERTPRPRKTRNKPVRHGGSSLATNIENSSASIDYDPNVEIVPTNTNIINNSLSNSSNSSYHGNHLGGNYNNNNSYTPTTSGNHLGGNNNNNNYTPPSGGENHLG